MMTLDENRKEAYKAFLTAHARIHQSIDSALMAANLLPLTWYDVLVTLEYANGHALRMCELADVVLLSRSGLTRLVDKLEEQGYVRRETCQDDRRGYLCVLTESGRAAREKSWPLVSSLIQELFGSLMNDEEVSGMHKICDRIVTTVKQFEEARSPKANLAVANG
ncbi:MAG: MarR family transcriptional regulator [Chthonomonadaceae bacterium]|nr:MarR family transcriptional regulator [Chthonomonadaceae bacterium]